MILQLRAASQELRGSTTQTTRTEHRTWSAVYYHPLSKLALGTKTGVWRWPEIYPMTRQHMRCKLEQTTRPVDGYSDDKRTKPSCRLRMLSRLAWIEEACPRSTRAAKMRGFQSNRVQPVTKNTSLSAPRLLAIIWRRFFGQQVQIQLGPIKGVAACGIASAPTTTNAPTTHQFPAHQSTMFTTTEAPVNQACNCGNSSCNCGASCVLSQTYTQLIKTN
ncbi:hypothetical protein B0H13DRAFT_292721 [Mycena leptocephala]|nr:hypothetical protein B0H13DRAFT_292721 [Mycena leptocephala]